MPEKNEIKPTRRFSEMTEEDRIKNREEIKAKVKERIRGAEPEEEKSKSEDGTIKEIEQHLHFIRETMMLKFAYRSKKEEMAEKSLDKIKEHEAEEKKYNELFDKAKEQLASGRPGKEILKVILEFPTQEELRLKENLEIHKKWLSIKEGSLNIDKLSTNDPRRTQMESYKKQIESEEGKRKEWAKRLKEQWEERIKDLVFLK